MSSSQFLGSILSRLQGKTESAPNEMEVLDLVTSFSKSVAAETDERSLLARLVGAVTEAGVDFAYVYRSNGVHGKSFRLVSWSGAVDAQGLPAEISERLMNRILANRLVLTKEQGLHSPGLKRVLGPLMRSEEWMIAKIPTGFKKGAAVLVAGNSSAIFTDIQKRLIDHMIGQAGLGIDKLSLAESAQSSSRSKAAFLANMSHEIRTPLNALIGFSEILISESMDHERRASVVSNIRKNGEYLTRMIDDVLDLSIVESGDFKVHHRLFSVEKLLADIRTVAELKAAEKGLSFEVILDSPLPKELYTDDVRLKQVLLNLINNAIKFTKEGSVILSLSWRTLSSEAAQLVIYIEDTGVGIPDEAQGQLFQPFSQADETTTRKFGGPGLGLALAARISDEIGAQLKLIRSVRGVGTVFEVIVPAKAVNEGETFNGLSPASSAEPLIKRPSLKGSRILLVEDAIDNQEIFSHFLTKAGAEVVVVDNGADAIERALEENFHLTLMDIQIPVIDGKEATRQLRSSGYLRPIVALTAHAMREERDTCIRAGCDGQITKPICEREFLSAVQSYLDSSKMPQVVL